MRRAALAVVACVGLLGATAAHAQLGGGPGSSTGSIPEARDLIQVTATAVTVAAGGRAQARVTVRVREGWHVNANPPALDYMIPTEVTLEPLGGLTAETPVYPPAKRQKLSFEEKPLLVYDYEFQVTLTLAAAASAAQGSHALRGRFDRGHPARPQERGSAHWDSNTR